MSLVPADNGFAMWGVLAGAAGFAAWAEHTRLGHRISGVLVAIFLAMALSNFRIIPQASPTYDTALEYLIPMSIPLLLFDANLRRIVRDTGRMLLAFTIGTAGTVLGAWIGVRLISLGPETPALAGVFSSTYIGGGLNFMAVARITGFSDGSMMAASVAADNVVTALYMMAVMALPSIAWLRRRIPSPVADRADREFETSLAEAPPADPAGPARAETPLRIAHLGLALALSLAICAAGFRLAEVFGLDGFGILFVSLLALVPANLFPRITPYLTGHAELGMIGIYVFLFVMGAAADLWTMLGSALPITAFALLIVAVHMVFIVAVGALFRLDLAMLVIASNACVGGSSSAGPLAAVRGWRELVTPGILCGALGNAVGTFIGVGLSRWLT
ncbi:MAG: DUF819 domain-containing protein [Gemmatimonadales bacterium]